MKSRFKIRAALIFAISVPGVALLFWPSAAQRRLNAPALPSGGSRGPIAITFSADGKKAYVAERDTGEVEVLDADSGTSLARIPSGGKEPTSLALVGENRLVVANSFSDSIAILDIEKRAIVRKIEVPGGPWEILAAPDGRAFVSLSRLDTVALIDLETGQVEARIPVGRRPRAMTFAQGNKLLLCANMSGGSVSIIDPAARKEIARVPVDAINLRGIATAGTTVYVTGQRPHAEGSTERPESMWTNVVCKFQIDSGNTRETESATLDSTEFGAADPTGIMARDDFALVALGGAHSLLALDSRSMKPLGRNNAGIVPRGITLRPRSSEAWVANSLSNSITVHDSGSGALKRTITLAVPARQDRGFRGRFLFSSAHLARGGRFSCSSCHPDGSTEGRSWRFDHLKDGAALRNSRGIRGGILLTAPYRWVAKEQDFEEFVNDEVEFLFHSRKLAHGEVHALWEMVNEFDLPPNPHRARGGGFTESAQRGKAVFTGRGECVSCHGGSLAGGTGKQAAIGTAGVNLDVPHLVGAYDTAPYLHDGRAASLEAIFNDHNARNLHGKAHLLTDSELADVLRYVREL